MNNTETANLLRKNFLYMNAFEKESKSYCEGSEDKESTMNKLILYGVKIVNTTPRREIIDRNQVLTAFRFASSIQSLISDITPKEFQNIFPIDKNYCGHKMNVKDYFYTKEYLKSFNADERIGGRIIEFLWNYQNKEINNFMKKYMFYLSKLRQFDGYPSIMEEWARNHNFTTYTRCEDDKGNVYVINNNTGEVTQIDCKGNVKALGHFKNTLIESEMKKKLLELIFS